MTDSQYEPVTSYRGILMEWKSSFLNNDSVAVFAVLMNVIFGIAALTTEYSLALVPGSGSLAHLGGAAIVSLILVAEWVRDMSLTCRIGKSAAQVLWRSAEWASVITYTDDPSGEDVGNHTEKI